jgi:hypothetical protein
MAITVQGLVQDVESYDTIEWLNNTGSDVVNGQLVFIAGDTGYGMVGVAKGQKALAGGEANDVIQNGEYGVLVIRGRYKMPAAAAGYTIGETAWAATGSSSVTAAAAVTTGGYAAVGLITKLSAVGNPTTASFVEVDLNYGPKAFVVN